MFLLGIDRLMREVTEGKRGIHWTFTTTLEGEDFADDITIQSHTQQIMQIWHVKLTKKEPNIDSLNKLGSLVDHCSLRTENYS